MPYHLGIDLGTTYSAAATWRGDRPYVVNLGSRTATIPSVVLLRDDGELLTGEAAERRAVIQPQRVAREFKRRLGDPTPVIIGGTPYSAPALTARLLRAVVETVIRLEGEPPSEIVVAHPANWGDYKQDLLYQAIHLAELDGVTTLTEPEAAAIHYAAQERVAVGSNVAVYDLGGGTFDAAVLRRTDTSWECLGEPEGIEHLGGIDFDEAIFQNVKAAIGLHVFESLDPDDPPTRVGVARLRQECVQAKEALTFDTVVSIPVLLPTAQMEIRLTRSEFEDMIRPSLVDSIAATKRAIRSAGIDAAGVSTVLLVGGSSRIPLVAQLVEAEIGRPVAVDAHPKHVVALGSAITAAERADTSVDRDRNAGGRSVALAPVPLAGSSLIERVPASAMVAAASVSQHPDASRSSEPRRDDAPLPLLRMPSSAVATPEPLTGAGTGAGPTTPPVGTDVTDLSDVGDDGDDSAVGAAPVGDGEPERRSVGVVFASLFALVFIAATAWVVLRSDGGGAQQLDGSTPSTAAISGSDTVGDDDSDDDDPETTTSTTLPPDASTTVPSVTSPPPERKTETPPTTPAPTSPPTTQPTTTTTAATTTTEPTTTSTETTTTTAPPG